MADNNKLTPKQENFVQRLFIGDTQRDAYKGSYNVKRMSDKAVDEEACKLANSPKIAQRLKELQQEAAKAAVWDKERSLKELIDIVETAKNNCADNTVNSRYDSSLLNAATKAIAEINKILGFNVETLKIDTTENQQALLKYLEATKNGNK